MKIIKGSYEKKDGHREFELCVFNRTESNISGIDLSLLSPEDKDHVLELSKFFDNLFEPYIKKAFRKFSIKKMSVEK